MLPYSLAFFFQINIHDTLACVGIHGARLYVKPLIFTSVLVICLKKSLYDLFTFNKTCKKTNARCGPQPNLSSRTHADWNVTRSIIVNMWENCFIEDDGWSSEAAKVEFHLRRRSYFSGNPLHVLSEAPVHVVKNKYINHVNFNWNTVQNHLFL